MRRHAFTLLELLVTIVIIGVMAGLLLPAIQAARATAARAHCANNLRQIGLALQLYHDARRAFPASGWTQPGPDNPGGQFVGWRPVILPYLEQEKLQKLYDFNANWWEHSNRLAASVPIQTFQCPSVPERREVTLAVAKPPRPATMFLSPIAPTDYEAVMGVQPGSINPHLISPIYDASNRFSVMSRNSRTRLAEVLDGTSSTIMIVECGGRPLVFRDRSAHGEFENDQGIGWADSEGPFSLDGASADGAAEGCGPASGCTHAMNKRNDNEPYGFHDGGINVLFVDGHGQFLRADVELRVAAAFCTMNAADAAE